MRLAVALSLVLCAPITAAQSTVVPTLAEMAAEPQSMAPIVQRYLLDLASVEHVNDARGGPQREAALREFFNGWLSRLDEVDYEALGVEDRLDWHLLSRAVRRAREQLDFDRERFEQARPLMPGIDGLLGLVEARRSLTLADARGSAQTLESARDSLDKALSKLRDAPPHGKDKPTAAVANRAANQLEATRGALKGWYAFYADYDPQFTWWNKQPYEALDRVLGEYASEVKAKLADASDKETIVGDPIGREALVRGFADALIPYSPEELLQLAEREMAWCRAQMQQAAKELGYDDWRKALDYVKTRHVAPGRQPALVLELADEAIDYVTKNDLVTVPPLARRDWRMTMLDAEAQLQAPFFLGGEDVWVAFPSADMPFDKKLDSLRGNNRHFSRAVVHHELIPGHHLQHFMASRYQPQREGLGWNPFWGEGWALYWEFLLWDRGFAATPEDRIGMLFWRSHRAARIQFSLGFHLGKMTPDQAIDLLVEEVGHERENAAAEVRRSFAGDYGPLYQAAYMLGGLQFRALHKEFVDSGKMTDRQFHDRILQGGPMPVQLVRERLLGTRLPRTIKADWRFYDL
jgi:uncharacterized protein (DUF885 family)